MQTLTRPEPSGTHRSTSEPPRLSRLRRRPSPQMFVGMIVTAIIVLGAGAFLITRPQTGSHAAQAAANPNCTLIVPPDPLSAQGLATPYKLVATNPADGPCHEANVQQSAFVQAAVIDPATGKISVYDPLVIDKGKQPAQPPVVPQLPQDGVVGIWFGFNGTNLLLRGTNNSLQAGNCINGTPGSIFGQFSYCNAVAFFQAANQAIQSNKLRVPALGTAKDGRTCPTVRDFSVVDQDQSDNVTTAYLVDGRGRTAQVTAANDNAMQQAQLLTNGSDNGLIDNFIDPAMGCQPWAVPNLADPGQTATALPLDELQAAMYQGNPVALVPAGDPMVLVNNHVSLLKTNLYRSGVDQPAAADLTMASTAQYCANMKAIGPDRILLDAPFTRNAPTPNADMATNLFNFLAQRFQASWMLLNCQRLLRQPSPIKAITNGAGVAVGAFINGVRIADNMPTTNQNGNGNKHDNGNGKGNNGNQQQQCTSKKHKKGHAGGGNCQQG
jgi:hypothetical protein